MTEDDDDELIVRPLNLLPAEKENLLHPDPVKVAAQKKFIRDRIINKENADLLGNVEAMQLLSELGSDLMINAFACNFKVNGRVNMDVVSSNSIQPQGHAINSETWNLGGGKLLEQSHFPTPLSRVERR